MGELGSPDWFNMFQSWKELQLQVPVSFKNCVAAIGGGLDAYMVNGTEPMYFHQCQATEAGQDMLRMCLLSNFDPLCIATCQPVSLSVDT